MDDEIHVKSVDEIHRERDVHDQYDAEKAKWVPSLTDGQISQRGIISSCHQFINLLFIDLVLKHWYVFSERKTVSHYSPTIC